MLFCSLLILDNVTLLVWLVLFVVLTLDSMHVNQKVLLVDQKNSETRKSVLLHKKLELFAQLSCYIVK